MKFKYAISQWKFSEEALQNEWMKQANDRVSRHKVKNCNNKKRKRKIYKGQPHRIGTYRKCGTPLKY